MKSKPEYVEGPEASERFVKAMRRIMAVPHDVIQQRIQAHREQAANNPRKRGPKRKSNGSKGA